MKIGDKVRFLNETGGGIVAGFQGNNIILVEDEDGFQIPVNIREIVVVDNDSDKKQSQKFIAHSAPAIQPQENEDRGNRSVKSLIGEGCDGMDDSEAGEEEYDPADREITFEKPVEERPGGNILHVYLCFVPDNIGELSRTKFGTYIVNNSNYHICYAYSAKDGQVWLLRSQGEIAPNTRQFIEDIQPEELNGMGNISLQIIAFKRKKDFVLKPTVDVQLRIEPLKFHKLHSYQENNFFESKAIIHTIIANDRPATVPAVKIDPEKIRQEMLDRKNNKNLTTKAKNEESAEIYSSSDPSSNPDKNLIVIDLHANKLLETIQGMTAIDILQYQLDIFRKVLKEHAKNKGLRIVFIHGKGEGVLRRAILNELNYRYKTYRYQDASFREYGYGATQVTIK